MSTDKNDIIVEALTSKIAALNAQVAALNESKNDLSHELQEAKTMVKYITDATDTIDTMNGRSAVLLRSFIVNKHADLLPALCEYVVDTVKYKMPTENNRYDIGLLALQDVIENAEDDDDKKRCYDYYEEIEELAGFIEK